MSNCKLSRREHLTELLVNGHCWSCLRAWSVPESDERVFKRLDVIKDAGL